MAAIVMTRVVLRGESHSLATIVQCKNANPSKPMTASIILQGIITEGCIFALGVFVNEDHLHGSVTEVVEGLKEHVGQPFELQPWALEKHDSLRKFPISPYHLHLLLWSAPQKSTKHKRSYAENLPLKRNISLTIPIFILTLHGSADRRRPVVETLEAYNVAFELWYGVDGRDGLSTEHEGMIDRKTARQIIGRDMGNSEFACALSHHFIYRAIIDQELPCAVVLEDDAVIDTRFLNFLEHQDAQDYDLLLLDHMRADVFRSDFLKFQGGLTAYRVAFSPMLTTGYIVSNQGAKTLVDKSLPIKAAADWPIDISEMNAFAMDPRVVDHPDQETGPSYIRHERTALSLEKPGASRLLEGRYWKKKYKKWASERISW